MRVRVRPATSSTTSSSQLSSLNKDDGGRWSGARASDVGGCFSPAPSLATLAPAPRKKPRDRLGGPLASLGLLPSSNARYFFKIWLHGTSRRKRFRRSGVCARLLRMPYVPPTEAPSRLQGEEAENLPTKPSVGFATSSSTGRETEFPRTPSRNRFPWIVDLDELDGTGQFGECLDPSWDSPDGKKVSWSELRGATFKSFLRAAMRRVLVRDAGLASLLGTTRWVVFRWTHGISLPRRTTVRRIAFALSLSQSELDGLYGVFDSDAKSPKRMAKRLAACKRLRGHRNGMTDEQYADLRRRQTRERVRRFRERRRSTSSYHPTQPTTQNPKETQP